MSATRPPGDKDAAPADDTSAQTTEQGWTETHVRSAATEIDARPEPELPLVPTDSYEIIGEFARGGLGRILSARDRVLNRPVALKELIHGRGEATHRFLREALTTARLQHPNIVPVYEAGRWPSGEPFYAMKLVSGRPLDRVIAEATTLADRLALLPRLASAADAIAYAHSQRVIHRDLKPAN